MTEGQAAQIALDTLGRMGFAATDARSVSWEEPGYEFQEGVGYRFRVDGRWSVRVLAATGDVCMVASDAAAYSQHSKHVGGERPTPEGVEKAGRELIARAFPSFDMRGFQYEPPRGRLGSGPVNAKWQQWIGESGFPGPGRCHVFFCWQDRGIIGMGAEQPPVPSEWRKPGIAAEQALEVARAELGDVAKGGWLEALRAFCARSDATGQGPAWLVLLRQPQETDPSKSYVRRGMFIDPWEGRVTSVAYEAGCEPSPGPGGYVAPGVVAVLRPGAETKGTRHAWMPWSVACAMALGLGVGLRCARRAGVRRSRAAAGHAE